MHKWTGWRSKVVANVKSLSPAYVLEWVDAMARHSQIHTNAQIECVLSGSLIPFRLFSHRIFCVRLSWLILFVLIEFVSHCLREEEKKDEYNECVLRQSSVCICNEVWHTTHRRKIMKRWKKNVCKSDKDLRVYWRTDTFLFLRLAFSWSFVTFCSVALECIAVCADAVAVERTIH